jgi:hypothetical protein
MALINTKDLTARLCVLCEELYPDEWLGKYTMSREDFKDWINIKTSLNENHITNQVGALTAWVNKLEEIKAAL